MKLDDKKGSIMEKLREKIYITKKKTEATPGTQPDLTNPEQPKQIDNKEPGLKTQMKDLNEKLDLMAGRKKDPAKKKNFKLPFGMKGKLKKLVKKNKIQIMLLQSNKNIKPTIGEFKEGMLFVGDKIYDGSADVVWLWDGKTPTAIIFEGDLKPLTSTRLYEKSVEENSTSHPQKIMIRAMELSEVINATKPGMNSKTLIWIFILMAVGAYVLFGNVGG